MKEMEYTVEGGGPLLPFLLERVRGSRNHVKSLLTRGQVEVDGGHPPRPSPDAGTAGGGAGRAPARRPLPGAL